MRRLQAQDVSYAYEADERVLDSVTATVASGQLTSIVGPNGCGKSTLLRLLCGLKEPMGGQVLLDDKRLRAIPGRERARIIGFLPQAVEPVFAMTVLEVAALGRYPYAGVFAGLNPGDHEIIARCLADTTVEHLKHRDFATLSGGERQRVLLAGVLAQEPDILLLDEPTSALDLPHQVEIFALLRRLTREGYGVGVVTHDLNLAAQFCDAATLLSHDHRLVADGSPRDVFTEPLLSGAYNATIRVCTHPVNGAPLIFADV